MDIRLANDADVPVIRDIVQAAYTPWIPIIGMRPMPLSADYESLVAAGVVWVIDEPIAGLIVLIEEPDGLLIENVAVHPAHQGRGIGKTLLAFAETRGKSRLRLYTHHLMSTNITIYEHLGYTPTHLEPPVLHMHKHL
jgi:GNAT superfamily N-acetyltransferase